MEAAACAPLCASVPTACLLTRPPPDGACTHMSLPHPHLPPPSKTAAGNAEVALGQLDEARAHFEAAASRRGSGVELLAAANLVG